MSTMVRLDKASQAVNLDNKGFSVPPISTDIPAIQGYIPIAVVLVSAKRMRCVALHLLLFFWRDNGNQR